MKVAVFILALIGGIFALLGTVVGLGLTGVAAGLGADQTQTTDYGTRLLLGFILAVATIVGGSLVLTNRSPRRWGIVLIVVSLIGSVAAGGFYVLGGLLGLIAGIIALFVKPQATVAVASATPSPPPVAPIAPDPAPSTPTDAAASPMESRG